MQGSEPSCFGTAGQAHPVWRRGDDLGHERASACPRTRAVPTTCPGLRSCRLRQQPAQGRAHWEDTNLVDDEVDTPRLAGTIWTRIRFGGSRIECRLARQGGTPGTAASAVRSGTFPRAFRQVLEPHERDRLKHAGRYEEGQAVKAVENGEGGATAGVEARNEESGATGDGQQLIPSGVRCRRVPRPNLHPSGSSRTGVGRTHRGCVREPSLSGRSGAQSRPSIRRPIRRLSGSDGQDEASGWLVRSPPRGNGLPDIFEHPFRPDPSAPGSSNRTPRAGSAEGETNLMGGQPRAARSASIGWRNGTAMGRRSLREDARP
jgi:hypothetical protein